MKGLGHGDGVHRLQPERVALQLLQEVRVGHCRRLAPLNALAFAMSTHSRLGSRVETAPGAADKFDFPYAAMPGELVQRVVEASVLWPEGRVGKLEWVVRLLGGGLI